MYAMPGTLKKERHYSSPVMLHTVSHVLFPYGRQPFIYTFLCSVFASVRLDRLPYQIWVSRLRGLPVPSALFPEQLVSVALLQHEYRSSALGIHTAVKFSPAWIYRFIQHKHYGHRRPCEHGLSSGIAASDCPYPASFFKNFIFQT